MLRHGVQGICDIITIPGLINVDFADVKAVMSSAGSALMGVGSASGEGRAIEAARTAISSPLLETSIDGASGVIFNVTGGPDLTLYEVNEAAEVIYSVASPEANIIFGSVIDERVQGEIRITVIATGFDGGRMAAPRRETVTSVKAGSAPSAGNGGPSLMMPPNQQPVEKASEAFQSVAPAPSDAGLDIPPFLRPHR